MKLDLTNAREIAARICTWRRPLLITHSRPDGDALGSMAAMRVLLQSQGITATPLLFEPVPPHYAVFRRFEPMPIFSSELSERNLKEFDGVIILDTCTYSQLLPLADWLRASGLAKLAVDHHRSRDDLADLYLIDESAAANCLILYEWANALGWPIAVQTAEALLIGIATDTGWFRHSNTDQRALAAAAELTSRGARPYELFHELYQRDSAARVRLLGAALSGLELVNDGQLAVMTLPSGVFKDIGATLDDTEDVINEPLRITSVVVSVLLVEQADGIIRASFRSKPPLAPGDADIDMSVLAQSFGGGGHSRAAGARVKSSLADARRGIIQALEPAFGMRRPQNHPAR